ncbi:MAG: glycoside hydrolase family 16 protein [Anaerolineales bacterium]|jgi:beta-glucanase (GH16 family)
MKRIAYLIMAGILFLTACTSAIPHSTATPTVILTLITSPTYGWNSQGWKLVWSDEFDGKTIDTKNWVFDKGGNGWGNAEMEYYTDRPENARVENGMLIIEARQEQYEGLNYTSARLNSRGLQEFQYGRIEARMKLPSGQGIWPAFWMLGSNASWPLGGEIDIMEYVGKTPDTIYQTVHGPGYSGAKGIGSHFALNEDSLKNDFHVYAIEWAPNEIRWSLDAQEVFKVTPEQIPAGMQWVFDHPFFIILNLAVGGGWPGFPDDTTVFPQQLLVDYVRVYQK